MKQTQILQKTTAYVKKTLKDAEGGHDWWHVLRVLKLSKSIAKKERVDLLVVELGALLHDIADSKFYNGDESVGPQKAREFLSSQQVDETTIRHVENIVAHISFKGGNHQQTFKSKELDVIQDADRLDALGAIGIARAFSYGGHKERELYNPNQPPKLNMTKDEYKNNKGSSINHFYEKLLLLKDRMNTKTGREIAQKRHEFMKTYLKQFYGEWDGEI